MNRCSLKYFVVACSFLAVTRCSPIGEESNNKSNTTDDAAHRMLVWPPRVTRKNISSDTESLRTPGTQEVPEATILRNTNDEKAQDRSNTATDEVTLLTSKENNNLNNESQSSNHEFHTIINKNVRMTNWVNNLPKESNPEHAHVDIDSIQLTTSEPQIIPSVETVAVFRNVGTLESGNNTYNVEVEEITTNITEVTKNGSQAASEESKLERNLQTSSTSSGIIKLSKQNESDEETEVQKTHISESLEHNTEIYGKTAAEELAGLSVIDVLLRKRRKSSTVKRHQPEFDSSAEVLSSQEESQETLGFEQNSSANANIHNVTVLSTTEGIKPNTSQSAKHPSNGTHSSVVRSKDRELQSKQTDNTNATNSEHQLSYIEGNPVYSLINSSHITNPTPHYNNSSEFINSGQKGDDILQARNSEKNLTFYELQGVSSTNSDLTVSDLLPTNESQAPKHETVGESSNNKTSARGGINISSNGNIRRSDDANSTIIPNNNSTLIHTGNKFENVSLVTSHDSPTKHSADPSSSGHNITNEELNASAETTKNTFNIPQSNVQGKNLHDTKTEKSLNEANVGTHNLTSNNPLYSTSPANNYTESNSKQQNSTINGTIVSELHTEDVTPQVFNTTEKAVKVEKVSTTEKETLFEGFKSIAEYIGFSA